MGKLRWTKAFSPANDGDYLTGSDMQNLQTDISGVVNGGISNSNISTDGSIDESKLAFDTSAGHNHDGLDSRVVAVTNTHYIASCDVEYVSVSTIKANPGTFELNGSVYSRTTFSSIMDMTNSAHYLSSPQSEESSTWYYMYAYNDSGISWDVKISKDEPLYFTCDTGDTVGELLRYYKYGTTWYRCIGKFYNNSNDDITGYDNWDNGRPVSRVSLFGKFGGDGTDGAQTLSGATNFSDIDSAIAGYAQLTNLDLNGETLTIDTGWAIIGCTGTCTIDGTLTADGQGESGGSPQIGTHGGCGRRADGVGKIAGGTADQDGISYTNATDFPIPDTVVGLIQDSIQFCVSGAGGGGGEGGGGTDGGCGGGAGSYGGKGAVTGDGENAVSTPATKIKYLTGGSTGDNSTHGYSHLIQLITRYRGAGGGSGGSDGGATAIGGGDGGGVIYIECNELIFTGTLTADGVSPGNEPGGGQHGGSGGGGGGVILIRAKTITTNSGTVTATGGVGGNGYNGGDDAGDGADGFKEIIQVN